LELNNIKEFINKVFLNLGIEKEMLKDSHLVRENIGLDSTEVVEVSLAIKKQYGLNLNLKNDMKLGDIYNYVTCNCVK
jgi:acyl carrier protein